jgi:hypothetical protein
MPVLRGGDDDAVDQAGGEQVAVVVKPLGVFGHLEPGIQARLIDVADGIDLGVDLVAEPVIDADDFPELWPRPIMPTPITPRRTRSLAPSTRL